MENLGIIMFCFIMLLYKQFTIFWQLWLMREQECLRCNCGVHLMFLERVINYEFQTVTIIGVNDINILINCLFVCFWCDSPPVGHCLFIH